jgi:chromosome segregation ATPase
VSWWQILMGIVGGGAGVQAVRIAADHLGTRGNQKLSREKQLADENTGLRAALDRAETEANTYAEKYLQRVADTAEQGAQLAQLAALIALLKDEVAFLRESNSSLKSEIADLRRANVELRGEIADLRARLHPEVS